MPLIHCDRTHAPQILAILNDVIAHTTALWDYHPRTMDDMESWFSQKDGKYPVIAMVDEAGDVLGFATYGSFRPWPAYKYTVELSIHIHRDHRGKGLGKLLLTELIGCAREAGIHNIIAGIEAANTASIALHAKLGFTPCGTVRAAGFKFGQWLDLTFYQLLLETPAHPVDG